MARKRGEGLYGIRATSRRILDTAVFFPHGVQVQKLLESQIPADFCAFYLQDRASEQDFSALGGSKAVSRMLAVGDQMLKIYTVQNGLVDVKVKSYEHAATFYPSTCDLANECSITITERALIGNVISDCYVELPLKPGTYRVRILYRRLIKRRLTEQNECEIQLWREDKARPSATLKRLPKRGL